MPNETRETDDQGRGPDREVSADHDVAYAAKPLHGQKMRVYTHVNHIMISQYLRPLSLRM